MEFSHRIRTANIAKMKSESFDLLVIGGGITGVGIARDAALRGLKVALVEKGDFASGTSSKSSKLIHGGLRYLEHGEFRLVFEALRERNLLRKKAPHLAKPLPILFPIYKKDKVGLIKLGLGMWLYDLLALFRNIKFHRMFFKKRLLKEEPLLLDQGLKGGFVFYDSFTHDARLTLEVAKSAQAEGAYLSTYIQTVGFQKENGKLSKACLKDQLSEETFEVTAKCFMNATGPWSDVTRQFSSPLRDEVLRPTKGVHLVFERSKLPISHAFALQATDGRLFFLIPWGEHLILGTTDTDYKESLDNVYATKKDAEYLIASVNRYFPNNTLLLSDIISTYAGIRPLVGKQSADQKHKDEYKTSREHKIFKDDAGLLTIAGGKLTTYREMAKDVVDLISKVPCTTHKKDFSFLATNTQPTIEKAIDQEMVLTLSDYMMRRTAGFLTLPDQGVQKAIEILPFMAEKLGWSDHRKETELSYFHTQIENSKKYLL